MSNSSIDAVTIECKVSNVSHKAVEVVVENSKTVWVPRSLIYGKYYGDDKYINKLSIPRWFAEKNKIKHEEISL